MSKLLSKVKAIIPPLSPGLHKGQAGRTVVIGGSENYTGAPYYACLSSMLLGADMGHIICEARAGPILKSLSPDLIVFPYLHESSSSSSSLRKGPAHDDDGNGDGTAEEVTADSIFQKIKPLFDRMHAVIIGPGLGRDPLMQETTKRVLAYLRTTDTPVVIDADGLFLVTHNLDLVRGWKRVVLTPNVVEFERLRNAAGVPSHQHYKRDDGRKDGDRKEEGADEEDTDTVGRVCKELCDALGGVTILQKGDKDVVSNGQTVHIIDTPGGLKRCGGQGDVLSGTTGTFLAWWFSAPHNSDKHTSLEADVEGVLLAVVGASTVTRTASRIAFGRKGRGMMSTDVVASVGDSYAELFEDATHSKL